MPIQTDVPSNILTPGFYAQIDNSQAIQGTPAERHVALLIGLRRSTGTVAAEVVTAITGAPQGGEYFGRGSQLSQMITAWKGANPNTEVYALALNEDAAGVKATSTITIAGTATEDGSLPFVWGGKRRVVAVTKGDDLEDVAAAIAAADTADGDSPTTSAAVAEVVTVSARHKGAYGNDLSIFLNYYAGEKTPAGITVTITAFASGATDPDAADAIAVFGGDQQYHTIVTGFTADANMDLLEAEMLSRWSSMRAIEGIVLASFRGNYGATQTYGDARNSPYSTVIGIGPSPTPSWMIASSYAAVCAASSAADPAVPLQTLQLPGVLAPLKAAQFIRSERDLLLADGIATAKISDSGDVSIERARMTYQVNGNGVADPSYRDLETMRTLSYLRYSFRVRMLTKFARAKIADDGTLVAGQLIATPSVVRAECLALFREWGAAGLVEGEAAFAASLIVARDPNDTGRMAVQMSPNLVNQYRITAVRLAFIL